jgi:hypothetical protein
LRQGSHALARDHGISRATARRDLDEVITVLADEAPGLCQAPVQREKMSVSSRRAFRPCQCAATGRMMGLPVWLCDARSRVRRAAFVDTFTAAEVMAVRPEDKNARQVQQAFVDGATLAELEQHIAFLRSLGAPDDAHPRVGVNDDYEVTMMICVVERPAPQVSSAS